jgi:hypothetical protein
MFIFVSLLTSPFPNNFVLYKMASTNSCWFKPVPGSDLAHKVRCLTPHTFEFGISELFPIFKHVYKLGNALGQWWIHPFAKRACHLHIPTTNKSIHQASYILLGDWIALLGEQQCWLHISDQSTNCLPTFTANPSVTIIRCTSTQYTR